MQFCEPTDALGVEVTCGKAAEWVVVCTDSCVEGRWCRDHAGEVLSLAAAYWCDARDSLEVRRVIQYEVLEARWEPVQRHVALEVYCVGKWRPSGIIAQRPRPIRPDELARVRRQMSLNTAGGIHVVDLHFRDRRWD